MAIQVISLIASVYLVLESIYALNMMTRSERLCRRTKYVLSAMAGMWLAMESLISEPSLLELTFALVVALFVWPHTYEWLGKTLFVRLFRKAIGHD